MRKTSKKISALIVIILLSVVLYIIASMLYRPIYEKKTCLWNLKKIQEAIYVWARDKNAWGYDLPAWEDLVPKYLKSKPSCPAGGIYELVTVEDSVPRCSIKNHKI